jgi:hypothetical protein
MEKSRARLAALDCLSKAACETADLGKEVVEANHLASAVTDMRPKRGVIFCEIAT